MWWRVVLLCLAYWLLGAHFLRYSHTVAAAICLLAPAVLFVKSAIVVRVLQIGLLVGAVLVWAKSGFEYVAMRQAMDAPWLRLAFIMGGVTLFTLLSAWSGNKLASNRNRGS
ncbi:hypothetical protein [Shewanella chilikensis]|uniref:hypothetical protein n=1 Tax=Shewanella chilikensis TaxID=558541 RepID=UPI00399B8010